VVQRAAPGPLAAFPAARVRDHVYLVDPLGNLMHPAALTTALLPSISAKPALLLRRTALLFSEMRPVIASRMALGLR
jgi:hypothetical protein